MKLPIKIIFSAALVAVVLACTATASAGDHYNKHGNTLISDQFNDQVIEVDSTGNIVFSQGQIGVVGNGFNELNAPYDAKVVGDYSGLTAPK
jgi:hypothetical protein